MKKTVTLICSLIAFCSLTLLGCREPCGDSVDKQITAGMSYSDVVALVGSEGTQLEISPNICVWDTGDEMDLYVWFTRSTDDANAKVSRIERRADLVPAVGMSLDEIKYLLGSAGSTYSLEPNIHTWPSASENALYVWLDPDGKMLEYTISNAPNAKVGMTYDQVTDLFDREGTPVANVSGLYSWSNFFPGKITYVRFADGLVTEVFMDSEISIEVGLTYERLTKIYNCEGTRIGRWQDIYSWPTSDTKIGLFKFEDDGGTLKLVQFDASMADISVGMTLAELNEVIGAEGVDAGITTTTVYKWDTELEENLFVWLDSNMVVTRFCYAKDQDIELKIGMTRDDVIFALGDPMPNTVGRQWKYNSETNLYILFTDKLVSTINYVPKLAVYEGMTMDEIVEVMGREHDSTFGSGNIHYVWLLDEYEMFVAFDYDGMVNNIGFRAI